MNTPSCSNPTQLKTSSFAKALLVSILALGLGPFALVQVSPIASANPVSYTLYGTTTGWGFTSTTITSPGPDLTATPGETVTVTLYSEDGRRHDFSIDYDGNGFPDPGEPLSPDFGGQFLSPITYEFTITTTPGTYTYYCEYHAQQLGSFIVSTAPPPSPTVDFTLSPTSPIVGDTVTFTATGSDGTPPFTFAWTFGDGGTGTGETATHVYTTKGSYTVTVTLTDSATQTATATHTVVVPAVTLAVDFTSTPASPMVGDLVTFTGTASGGTGPYVFAWEFGDGSTGSSNPATRAYSTKDSYDVVMTVTDANGASASATNPVVVTPQPLDADFTFSPLVPSVGDSLTITATVTGGTGPYLYSWDFGDGGSSTVNPTVHSYTDEGTFNVVLTVIDANGGAATSTHSISVTAGLTADFSFNPTSPVVGGTITFTATVSGGSPPYSFSWLFGDGSSATGNPATHAYSTKGSFTVILTVTDTADASLTVEHALAVPAAEFFLDFTFDPATPNVGAPVIFAASATGGTPPYVYTWNFGDETTGTGSLVSHIYNAKGFYQVTLTLTDANGATVQTSHTMTVNALPLAVDFNFSPTSPSVGDTVTFLADTLGGSVPFLYSWDFGDTTTGTSSLATHVYTSEGTFTVVLTVTDANGATATATHGVAVSAQAQEPVAVINLYDDEIAPDRKIGGQVLFVTEEVIFDGSTSFDPNVPHQMLSYEWDFNGDGTTDSTMATARFTYMVPGSYTVTLTVTNEAGLSNTTTPSVNVYAEPHLIRGKMSWKHHITSRSVQSFIGKISNYASIQVAVQLKVDIYHAGTGQFVATALSAETPLGPGETKLDLVAQWTTPIVDFTTKYSITGTLVYHVVDPVTDNIVTGLDASKSGSFATVSP